MLVKIDVIAMAGVMFSISAGPVIYILVQSFLGELKKEDFRYTADL